MSPLKHDWITQTSSYGGFGTRPHAIKILPALHEDVLHRDGWTLQASTIFADCETSMYIGRAPFVRMYPTLAHPQMGAFRCDADDGHAVVCPALRVDHVHSSYSAGHSLKHRARLRILAPCWTRSGSDIPLSRERAESGRYDLRPPTSRKRKRERCKARRRACCEDL